MYIYVCVCACTCVCVCVCVCMWEGIWKKLVYKIMAFILSDNTEVANTTI